MYDLLLRGGELVDLDERYSGRLDLAITAGTISAVATGIDPGEAARCLDLDGKLVTPGLVDIHAHVYPGVTAMGMEPAGATFPGGVTAIADGGSCGSETFEGFRRWIAEPAQARVFCFVHLSRLGLAGAAVAGELATAAYADPSGVADILRAHPRVAAGVKIRVSRDFTGGSALDFVRQARRAAGDRPVMAHIGDGADQIEDVLALLGPGDIVTHFQTPKAAGLLDEALQVRPGVRAARERGVLFDCGHGRTHFSFTVAARLLELGFGPDMLSTDMSASSFDDLKPGLVTVMNKWLALGLAEREVILACTVRPAAALPGGARPGRVGGYGRLAPGFDADIAVLGREEGEFRYRDAVGLVQGSARRLVPDLTIRAGRAVWSRTGSAA
jgi:dihydroorotase